MLKYLVVILLTIVTIASAKIHKSKGSIELKQNVIKPDDFNFLVLRQQWPATACLFPGPHTCSIARNITNWTVHGLWYYENLDKNRILS